MLSSSIFSFRSRPFFYTVISLLLLNIVSCKKDVEQTQETTTLEDKQPKLFTTINSSESGIDFINTLEETLESNYFQYLYTYIGGGVAAGDINNDGLIDL